MYRTAVKRLSVGGPIGGRNRNACIRLLPLLSSDDYNSLFSTATASQSSPNNQIPNPHLHQQIPIYSDFTSSSSSSSSSSWSTSASEEAQRLERPRQRVDLEEEQARVLRASLLHVIKLGWTEAAMIAGARDVGVSPSIVGSFPRKEAALVEFFMEDCLQRLIDRIDSEEARLKNLIPSERISKLVRIRLEMQAPYLSKWPQALSIHAQPTNVPTSFKQRAMLVDEIWHAAGNDTSDIDWYVKRTILGGIYSTTEVYMLTDSSPDFRDTWTFLDNRVKDAFDLKKTIQEAKYLVEAVGAGMGSSLQGFMKKVFQT